MITVIVRKVNRKRIEENFDACVKTIEASRKARVLRIKRREAALVQLAASLLLQEVIESNNTLTEGYTLKTGEHGKPYVEELPDFYFNLSHSGDYVVVAYGDEEVGIDVEEIKEYRKNVAMRCCTKTELEYIEAGNSADDEADNQAKRFTEIWTMKESYAKFTGAGLADDFRTIDIDLEKRIVKNTLAKYMTKQHENYMISLCAENPDNVKFVY